jgi:hypothetical protein
LQPGDRVWKQDSVAAPASWIPFVLLYINANRAILSVRGAVREVGAEETCAIGSDAENDPGALVMINNFFRG